MVASLIVAMALSSPSVQRTFHYVPRDTQYDPAMFDHRPWISCDGHVEGVAPTATAASLEVSHWNGNATPDRYYADTSTEMALLVPPSLYPDAVVVNNHYDTDGLLSIFACLEPHQASLHAPLLRAAAEAGDFHEWSSDEGIMLNACIESLRSSDNAQSYRDALALLPTWLDDIRTGRASHHQALWQPTLDEARADFARLTDGTAVVQPGPGSIVLVGEPALGRPLSTFAVHRHLVDTGLWSTANRILRYTKQAKDETFTYRYEKPGYSWVSKLRDRRSIPDVTDTTALVEALNTIYDGEWTVGGPQFGVALCQTRGGSSIDDGPHDVADVLLTLDAGAAA